MFRWANEKKNTGHNTALQHIRGTRTHTHTLSQRFGPTTYVVVFNGHVQTIRDLTADTLFGFISLIYGQDGCQCNPALQLLSKIPAANSMAVVVVVIIIVLVALIPAVIVVDEKLMLTEMKSIVFK